MDDSIKKPLISSPRPESPSENKPAKAISKSKKEDASIEAEQIEVVESQILGVPRRKSSGLKTEEPSLESGEQEKTEDESAIDIEVQQALARAKERSEAAKNVPRRPPTPAPSAKPKRRKGGRGRNKTYQPAAREKRLDRAGFSYVVATYRYWIPFGGVFRAPLNNVYRKPHRFLRGMDVESSCHVLFQNIILDSTRYLREVCSLLLSNH